MEAFEKFDKNKDGSLGLKEIQRLVEALNVKMSPGQVKKKFKVRERKKRNISTRLGKFKCEYFLTSSFATSIHRKKKDGGCTFYHNTLRTKLRPLGIWKDIV